MLRYMPIFVAVGYYLLASLLGLYVTNDGGHVLDTVDWLVEEGVWASNRTSYPEDYSSHFLYVVMVALGKWTLPLTTLQISYIWNAAACGLIYWVYNRFHSHIISGVALVLSGGFFLGLVSFSTPVLMAFYAVIMYTILKHPKRYRQLFTLVLLATLFRWESLILCSGLLICVGYQAWKDDDWKRFLLESLNFVIPFILYCLARYSYFGTILGEDGHTPFQGNYGFSHLWVTLFSIGLAIPLLKSPKLYYYIAVAIPASALFWMINVVGSQAARYYAPLVVIATILCTKKPKMAVPILITTIGIASVFSGTLVFTQVPLVKDINRGTAEVSSNLAGIPGKTNYIDIPWIYNAKSWVRDLEIAQNERMTDYDRIHGLDMVVIACDEEWECSKADSELTNWTLYYTQKTDCYDVWRIYVNKGRVYHDNILEALDHPTLWESYTDLGRKASC